MTSRDTPTYTRTPQWDFFFSGGLMGLGSREKDSNVRPPVPVRGRMASGSSRS